MKRRCFLTALAGSFTAAPSIVWGDPPPRKDMPVSIEYAGERDTRAGILCVLDGDLTFLSTFENGLARGKEGAPPLPQHSFQFLWQGFSYLTTNAGSSPPGMLRVKVVALGLGVEQGSISKKLLAKNGWYVAADFSTDPPEVTLTENPTKGCRWQFHDGFGSRKFIKNTDASGKAVWLAMGAEENVYSWGITRKVILSETKSAKKNYFVVNDPNSGK